MKERRILSIYHECEGWIEKSVPRISDWHHEACRVMTSGDHEGRIFFYHTLTRIMDSFSCTPLKPHFILTSRIDVHQRATVRFLSFPRAGMGVWDRNISHGWKQRKSRSGVREIKGLWLYSVKKRKMTSFLCLFITI